MAQHSNVSESLKELLEIERAIACAAMSIGLDARSPELAVLCDDIELDEFHWCGLLMKTIRSLGDTPSDTVSNIEDRALACGHSDRLEFLRDCQELAATRLQALIPAVEVSGVRASLGTILKAHRQQNCRLEMIAALVQHNTPSAM